VQGSIIILVAIVALVVFVALPSMIALARQHPEKRLIYRLTPLATFSFVLWFVLIVWASSDKRNDAVISRYVAKLRQGNQLPLVIATLVAIGAVGTLAFYLRP